MGFKTANQVNVTDGRAAQSAALARRERRREDQLDLLSTLDCLRGVSRAELAQLADLALFRVYVGGAVILSEREQSQFLTILLSGNAELTLHDREGREVSLGIIGRGDCCGEEPLLGDVFRRASVRAEDCCTAIQIALADLRAILPEVPGVVAGLRRIYRQRLVDATLARVPLFSQLLPLERLALGALLQPVHFDRGNEILRQGEPGEALYLIEAGQVVVEQNETLIATLKEGDFCGEMALLTDRPITATVRALTPTDVLKLPSDEFRTLLTQRPDIERQMRVMVEQRIASGARLRNDQYEAHQLMRSLDRGLLRGSQLLVRRPELCPPDCRICETACITRHGQQRLSLNGVTVGNLDVVDTCRQCRYGAECVESCPEDAIEWNEHGALFINDRCTGCGACVEACPYDAVTSVPIPGRRNEGPLWQLWRRMQRARLGEYTIPLEPARPTHRADKCDLCHGYDDLACLSACPTGSLQLIPVEEVFPL